MLTKCVFAACEQGKCILTFGEVLYCVSYIQISEDNTYFEVDKNGNVVLTKKKIDLNNISAEELKSLGIDPTLSAQEIAKKLKVSNFIL